MLNKKYLISFRCYYMNATEITNHRQELTPAEIPKWIDCYKFTHPACESITIKVWFNNLVDEINKE